MPKLMTTNRNFKIIAGITQKVEIKKHIVEYLERKIQATQIMAVGCFGHGRLATENILFCCCKCT